MASSTIPACKRAIRTILAARGPLAAVAITPGPPTKDEDYQGELIFLSDVNSDEDWSSLGAQQRREDYRVSLTVWVEGWGDDPQTVEERAYELWAEVTEGVRADIRTGGSLLRAAGVQQYNRITFRQITGPASAEKWGARIDAQISFTARTV